MVLTSVCSCFNSALYTCSRMLYSLSRRGDAHRIMQITGKNSGSPWVGVLISSIFSFVAIYLTATEKMDIYDVLMSATGTVAMYVYLCIAISQLKMRQKLQASGKPIAFRMWLFPWLTYAVIFAIAASLVVMVFEGTYRTEVIYTSVLAAVIIAMGLIAQKFNIGGQSQQNTAPLVGLQPEASAT